ncbi:hypothetical protein BSLG_006288 [Batrachochytrium salamandrivorans]|nr:hypothetical protein BASA62_007777 [Batrachochytrium salamandrivorans]KAH6581631.1 hypothetical protein BASA60_002337 [Batrachochytrium salamandrivorans]KAJ1339150.1 hypothetical protein BSLG_006288 [Batrachochytrium salamandrivorans]
MSTHRAAVEAATAHDVFLAKIGSKAGFIKKDGTIAPLISTTCLDVHDREKDPHPVSTHFVKPLMRRSLPMVAKKFTPKSDASQISPSLSFSLPVIGPKSMSKLGSTSEMVLKPLAISNMLCSDLPSRSLSNSLSPSVYKPATKIAVLKNRKLLVKSRDDTIGLSVSDVSTRKKTQCALQSKSQSSAETIHHIVTNADIKSNDHLEIISTFQDYNALPIQLPASIQQSKGPQNAKQIMLQKQRTNRYGQLLTGNLSSTTSAKTIALMKAQRIRRSPDMNENSSDLIGTIHSIEYADTLPPFLDEGIDRFPIDKRSQFLSPELHRDTLENHPFQQKDSLLVAQLSDEEIQPISESLYLPEKTCIELQDCQFDPTLINLTQKACQQKLDPQIQSCSTDLVKRTWTGNTSPTRQSHIQDITDLYTRKETTPKDGLALDTYTAIELQTSINSADDLERYAIDIDLSSPQTALSSMSILYNSTGSNTTTARLENNVLQRIRQCTVWDVAMLREITRMIEPIYSAESLQKSSQGSISQINNSTRPSTPFVNDAVPDNESEPASKSHKASTSSFTPVSLKMSDYDIGGLGKSISQIGLAHIHAYANDRLEGHEKKTDHRLNVPLKRDACINQWLGHGNQIRHSNLESRQPIRRNHGCLETAIATHPLNTRAIGEHGLKSAYNCSTGDTIKKSKCSSTSTVYNYNGIGSYTQYGRQSTPQNYPHMRHLPPSIPNTHFTTPVVNSMQYSSSPAVHIQNSIIKPGVVKKPKLIPRKDLIRVSVLAGMTNNQKPLESKPNSRWRPKQSYQKEPSFIRSRHCSSIYSNLNKEEVSAYEDDNNDQAILNYSIDVLNSYRGVETYATSAYPVADESPIETIRHNMQAVTIDEHSHNFHVSGHADITEVESSNADADSRDMASLIKRVYGNLGPIFPISHTQGSTNSERLSQSAPQKAYCSIGSTTSASIYSPPSASYAGGNNSFEGRVGGLGPDRENESYLQKCLNNRLMTPRGKTMRGYKVKFPVILPRNKVADQLVDAAAKRDKMKSYAAGIRRPANPRVSEKSNSLGVSGQTRLPPIALEKQRSSTTEIHLSSLDDVRTLEEAHARDMAAADTIRKELRL